MALNFQHYDQQQNWLFPPSIEELIPQNHPARIVNGIIEQLNLDLLTQTYSAEGKPSYHPKMMLKVMVYAYMDNIHSSRKIEKAMRENINFMWLSANQVADHNTIARFRSNKLKAVFKDIFKQVVLLLAEEGLATLKQIYTDGTKIESAAGRYTFVWGKAIKTRREKMAEQLEEMWQYAQGIADDENQDPEPPAFKEITPEKVAETAKKIEKVLKGNPKASPKAKAKLRYIKQNFAANLEKYEKQEDILGTRNSYSKTDPDATFMRMKDDHIQNGQLKPGYNVQISTQDQFVIHYTLHQNTNDIHALKPHVDSFEELYESLPEVLTADAGHGSEENYDYLEEKEIQTYVKYNTFDREEGLAKTKKRKKPDGFHRNNLYYNEQEDYYVCPMGQPDGKNNRAEQKHQIGIQTEKQRVQSTKLSGLPVARDMFKIQQAN